MVASHPHVRHPHVHHPLHGGAICTEPGSRKEESQEDIWGEGILSRGHCQGKCPEAGARWANLGDWPWAGAQPVGEGQKWEVRREVVGTVRQQRALCHTLFAVLNDVPQVHVPRTSGGDLLWK